jgi:hypothetical protein
VIGTNDDSAEVRSAGSGRAVSITIPRQGRAGWSAAVAIPPKRGKPIAIVANGMRTAR